MPGVEGDLLEGLLPSIYQGLKTIFTKCVFYFAPIDNVLIGVRGLRALRATRATRATKATKATML